MASRKHQPPACNDGQISEQTFRFLSHVSGCSICQARANNPFEVLELELIVDLSYPDPNGKRVAALMTKGRGMENQVQIDRKGGK